MAIRAGVDAHAPPLRHPLDRREDRSHTRGEQYRARAFGRAVGEGDEEALPVLVARGAGDSNLPQRHGRIRAQLLAPDGEEFGGRGAVAREETM